MGKEEVPNYLGTSSVLIVGGITSQAVTVVILPARSRKGFLAGANCHPASVKVSILLNVVSELRVPQITPSSLVVSRLASASCLLVMDSLSKSSIVKSGLGFN